MDANGREFKRIHSRSFAFIRVHSPPFASIRVHSRSFASIRLHSRSFASIRVHSRPFASIRVHSRSFASIRVHSRLPFFSLVAASRAAPFRGWASVGYLVNRSVGAGTSLSRNAARTRMRSCGTELILYTLTVFSRHDRDALAEVINRHLTDGLSSFVKSRYPTQLGSRQIQTCSCRIMKEVSTGHGSETMMAETGVKWLLRFISLTTLPAFVAVAMPQRWLVALLNWVEPGLSVGLFGSYLIRCLMAYTRSWASKP